MATPSLTPAQARLGKALGWFMIVAGLFFVALCTYAAIAWGPGLLEGTARRSASKGGYLLAIIGLVWLLGAFGAGYGVWMARGGRPLKRMLVAIVGVAAIIALLTSVMRGA